MRLTQREILLAAAMGVFAVVWMVFSFGVSPLLERLETLNRVIPEKENELEQIRVKSEKYAALHNDIESLRTRIASQNETFELLPVVESLVKECGLIQCKMSQQTLEVGTDYIETVVKVDVERVTLRQLYDFLMKLQSSQVLANIKTLQMTKNPADASMLDSLIEISNLKLSRT